MKKYLSFFRIRFIHGLQYRTAAVSGMVTQFVWGAMEILLFRAFYQADPDAFPMTFSALASYVWLQQAFLTLYMIWFWESDLFETITSGNVAYELCRPVRLYDMWFMRSLAVRLSKAVLRCMPVLIVALLLPAPYRLTLPSDICVLLLTLLTMALALLLIVAISMVIYMSTFFMISSQGIRLIVSPLTEFLGGAIIPLPFMPDHIRQVVNLLPFASAQNVPFRIYSGDLQGREMAVSVVLQVFWLLVFFAAGRAMERRALRQIVIQGG